MPNPDAPALTSTAGIWIDRHRPRERIITMTIALKKLPDVVSTCFNFLSDFFATLPLCVFA